MRVRLHSKRPDLMLYVLQTMPDEHPPTAPPTRWPALSALLTFAEFKLVRRRLGDVLLLPPCLVDHNLNTVCALPREQSGRAYKVPI